MTQGRSPVTRPRWDRTQRQPTPLIGNKMLPCTGGLVFTGAMDAYLRAFGAGSDLELAWSFELDIDVNFQLAIFC
jgi:hypothetical protein